MTTIPGGAAPPGALTALWARHQGLARFTKFGLVGGSGLVVNTAVLALWAGGLGFHYLLGVVIATQISSSWNFALTDRWVFSKGGTTRWSGWSRFIQFVAMNNLVLFLRGPIVWLLTEELGLHYLLSNIVSLVAFMIGRFAFSTKFIWGGGPLGESPPRLDLRAEPALVSVDAARVFHDRLTAVETEPFGQVAYELRSSIASAERTGAVAIDIRPALAQGWGQVRPVHLPATGNGAHVLGKMVTLEAGAGAGTALLERPKPLRGYAPVALPSRKRRGGKDISPAHPPARSRDWKRVVGLIALVAVPSLILRLVFLDSLGFNSDEAVYAGQAASISGDNDLLRYFPIFRAHPLFFHSSLSVVYKVVGISPLIGRLVAVFFGMLGVAATYLLGSKLYSRRTGVIAALILGVMPYHVMVSRQVLLDGPMVLFSTLTVYFLAKFAIEGRSGWLYSAAAMFGMTFLTNERSIVLLGSTYLFFAMSPTVKIRFRQMVTSMVIVVAMMLPYPMSVLFSGKTTTGSQFLAWQLFRRANHGWTFYPIEVSKAVGYFTLVAVALAVWRVWPNRSWKEVLLGAWCGVPILFFEIWPVKGFQYLLAIAPILAILAARGIDLIPQVIRLRGRGWNGTILRFAAVALVVVPLVGDSWGRAHPAGAGEAFLAGSGGVPGGREAGEWVAANVPEGGELLAIGPSMANIIQWYGDRKTYGLSVSPNPLHRNPVYEPIHNPDLLLRNGDLHYLVWDSFSAGRSEFFSSKLQVFAERYNGRIVHQEFVEVGLSNGDTIQKPVIIIYEVRP